MIVHGLWARKIRLELFTEEAWAESQKFQKIGAGVIVGHLLCTQLPRMDLGSFPGVPCGPPS